MKNRKKKTFQLGFYHVMIFGFGFLVPTLSSRSGEEKNNCPKIFIKKAYLALIFRHEKYGNFSILGKRPRQAILSR